MKKLLSLLVGGLVLLPFSVNALTVVNPVSCTAVDSDGNKTCTIAVDSGTEAFESFTATLTEQGGADIQSVFNTTGSDWSLVGTPADNGNGVWTVNVSSPGVSGEMSLFSFTYKVSGETDCKINVSLNGSTASTPETNEPTQNKQTGSTIPFIALGAMALLAGGAYVATKNKSKMFNI